MKNKQKTNSFAGYKYLLFVPLAIALLAMNSSVIRANVQKGEVREAQTVKKPAPDNKVYEACEQMPSYVGGQPALMRYLIENVRYPKAAVEAKQQGRVVVQFVVEKDGAVSSVKLLRSVTPLLDAEAIRVVKAMPYTLSPCWLVNLPMHHLFHRLMADRAATLINKHERFR